MNCIIQEPFFTSFNSFLVSLKVYRFKYKEGDLMKREEISREVLVTEEQVGNTKRQIKEIRIKIKVSKENRELEKKRISKLLTIDAILFIFILFSLFVYYLEG